MRTGLHTCWLAMIAATTLVAACASTPHAGDVLKTAEHVDVEHFMGRWYVISSIPNSTEKGRVGPYVEYAQRVDHRIEQTYYFHQADFDAPLSKKQDVASIVDIKSNAIWSTHLSEPLFSDVRILYVDPEYRYTVIGQPSRDYAWILARDMYISDDDYQQLVSVLSEQGYDPTRVLKIPPREEFMGIPGYQ
jgi:apolipoprotein D and lipocalin family protein